MIGLHCLSLCTQNLPQTVIKKGDQAHYRSSREVAATFHLQVDPMTAALACRDAAIIQRSNLFAKALVLPDVQGTSSM
jgi:hypothetical protein